MPFISDYLYHKLSGTSLENGDSSMVMNFPKNIAKNQNIEESFAIMKAITAIRANIIDMEIQNSKTYLKINKNIIIIWLNHLLKS